MFFLYKKIIQSIWLYGKKPIDSAGSQPGWSAPELRAATIDGGIKATISMI